MATQEQIKKIHSEMEKAQPVDFFKRINEIQAGIGAVLRVLYEYDGTVTAGQISEILEVSTARVAVLLKKMDSKGLITKKHSTDDARVTIVSITEHGKDIINIAKEINAVVKAPPEIDF